MPEASRVRLRAMFGEARAVDPGRLAGAQALLSSLAA
jgi:hypothetical protein